MSIRMINPGAGNTPNPVGDGVAVQPATVTILTDTEVIAEITNRRQIFFVTALPATGDTTHIWCLNNNELWVYSGSGEWRRINDKMHRINISVGATYSLNNTFTYAMPANTYVRIGDFVVFDNLFCIVTAVSGNYSSGFSATLRVLTTDLAFVALYRVVADMNPVVKVFQSTTVAVPTSNAPKVRIGDLLLIGDASPKALAIVTAMSSTEYTVTILADNVTNAVIQVPNEAALPATGDKDFLYITMDDQRGWYWTGSAWVHLSSVIYVADKTALPTAGDPNFFYITLDDRKGWYYNGTTWVSLTAGGIQVTDDLNNITLKDGETLYIVKRKTSAPQAPAEAYWYDPVADTFNLVYNLPITITVGVSISDAGSPSDPNGNIIVPVLKIYTYSRSTAAETVDGTMLMFRSNEDIVIARDNASKIINFNLPYYVKFQDPLPDPNAPLPKDKPKQNVLYKDNMQRLWFWDGSKYNQIQGKVISVEGYYPDETGNVALHLNNHPGVSNTNFAESLISKWFNGDRQSNSWSVANLPMPVPLSLSSTVADFTIDWYGKYPDAHKYSLHYYSAATTDPDAPAVVPAICFEDRKQDGTLDNQVRFTDDSGFWWSGQWSQTGFEAQQGGTVTYNSDPAEVDAFIQSIIDQGLITYSYQYYVDLTALIEKVDTHIADNVRHLTQTERDKINEGLVTSVENIKPDASGNVALDLDNTSPFGPAIPGAIWQATYDQDRKKHKFIVTASQMAYNPPPMISTMNFVLSDDGTQRGEIRFWLNGKVEWVVLNNGQIIESTLLADNGMWIDGMQVTFTGRYDSVSGDNAWLQALPENELGYQFADIFSMLEINDDLQAEIARATAAEDGLRVNIDAEIANRQTADAGLQLQIDNLTALGRYLGSLPTYADLATFTLPSGAGNRDFVTIQHDETNAGLSTRYVIQDLGPPVVWQFDLTYDTDITGKVDKLVSNWVPGHLARLVDDGNGNGNIEDAGKSLLEFGNEVDIFVYGRGAYYGCYDNLSAMHAELDGIGEPLAKDKAWVLVRNDENNRPAIYHFSGGTTWTKDYAWMTSGAPWPNYSDRTTLVNQANNGNPLQFTVTEAGWYQVECENTQGTITHMRVWVNDKMVYQEYDENNGYDNIASTLFLCWPGDVIYMRTYELNSTTVQNSYKRLYKFGNR